MKCGLQIRQVLTFGPLERIKPNHVASELQTAKVGKPRIKTAHC